MLGMRRKLLLQVFHDVRHNSIKALKAKKKKKKHANLAFNTFRHRTIHEIKLPPKRICVYVLVSEVITCSAWSSARWQRATAKASVLFCCTLKFTGSRLFIFNRS